MLTDQFTEECRSKWGLSHVWGAYQCIAGIVVRGCVWLHGRFFEDSFKAFPHFMMGDLWVRLPPSCWEFSSFWPKMIWPPCPPSQYTHSHPKWLFLPQMKKVLKGKCFACVEEVKQKMAKALKHIKIDEFENCFEQWKNHLHQRIASDG